MILPLDLESPILESLADNPAALATCSLVCKRWLDQSRRSLRSLKQVELRPDPITRREKLLQQLLFHSQLECSFWPHILDLSIVDKCGITETSPKCVHLLSASLLLAPNLETLRLHKIWFSTLPDDVLEKLSSLNSIFSIHLTSPKFASPNQLLALLASLPNLRHECSLKEVMFTNQESEPVSTSFRPHPTLEFQISAAYNTAFESIAPLIDRCGWNITNLSIELNSPRAIGAEMLQNVLRQIGPSLKEIVMMLDENHEPCEISFKHNTSLERIWVGDLVTFEPPYDSVASTQISSLLATIESGEKFQCLKCNIGYNPGDLDDEYGEDQYFDDEEDEFDDSKWAFMESFDWRSVEDVLMDRTRFPGRGPMFSVRLTYRLNNSCVYDLMNEKCLPRLSGAENLDLDYF